jgi:membrane-bound lytic murein transglycosylase F
VGQRLIYFISILLIAIDSCIKVPDYNDPLQTSFDDLDKIRERGKLLAVTDINSTNYFIYKGEPMGFHYELLRSFSDYLGLEIEIIASNDIPGSFDLLNSGQADLLAYSLTVNAPRKKGIRFSESIGTTRQVLVQRKPGTWRRMTMDEIDRSLVRKHLDLIGRTVYVQRGSSSVETLKNLEKEIGDAFNIVEVPYESEELISFVEKGEIDYTVCDENIAIVNSAYYPLIDIKTAISVSQNLAWGMRREGSDQLAEAADKWISSFKQTGEYALLYAKYFKNGRSGFMVRSDYFTLSTGKVSRWDDLIRAYSDSINWDWRLLASLVCQESRFQDDAVSHTGAYGLMQILPSTGENLGIDIKSSPRNNMKAGTKYINLLESLFLERIPDENERLRFILAAYNAGPGHVLDAMALARKNGMDPEKWDGNVAVWMLKKSEPQYYNDSVVKNGYFRGTESVAFVSDILDRYHHYKNIIPYEGI